MAKPQPKQNFQIRRMFGLAKPLAQQAGMEVHEFLSAMASHVTRDRTASLAELTWDEANGVITRLGGTAFSRQISRRTVNYRRQQAGVKAVETVAHLDFMDELRELNGMSPEGLEKMGTRMLGHWPPRTTEDGNKVIEALKSMLARKRRAAENEPPPPAEPAFRRVA